MNLRKDSQGMTLVELMTTCAIMIILMGIISLVISKTFFINKFSLEQGMNNTLLQNSLRNFSANFREARQSDAGDYPIVLADDFELIFYGNIDHDNVTERVHYFLDGTQLKMGITRPTGFPPEYPSGDQQIRVIGSGITNTSSQPLFYYYNKDYPEDLTHNPLGTPASIDQINMISIDAFANIDPNHIPNNQEMVTFVKPRNISTYTEDQSSSSSPQLSLSPNSKDFGPVRKDDSSSEQIITLSSTGGAILNVSDIVLSDTTNYSLDLDAGAYPCGSTSPSLGVDVTCTVGVTFTPKSTGTKNATLIITSNDPQPTNPVNLTGIGAASHISISPTSKNFGNVRQDTSSSAQVITISNTGTASLNVSSVSLSDTNNYGLNLNGGTTPCGSTTPVIATGSSCTVSVTFAPKSTGVKNATLGIVSDDPTQLLVNASLSGTGTVSHISLNPTSKDFGNVKQNTNSSAQVVTISNTGTASLNVSNISLSDTTHFGLNLSGGSSPCGSSSPTVNAGSSCTVSVTFSPKSTGSKSASLNVVSDDPSTPTATVSLSGTGVASHITLNPTSKDFGSIRQNSSSSSQMITISSSGTASLSVSNMSLSDSTNFSINISGGTNPCNSFSPTIATGSSCTISVTFGPKSTGAKSSTLTITSDDPASPTSTVSLLGTGIASSISLNPTSINFGSVRRNTSSSPQTVTLSNSSTASLNVSNIFLSSTTHYSLNLSGGSNPCGSTTPTIAVGSSCTVTVTFRPTSTGTKNATLNVASDDPAHPTATTSLTGVGTN